MDWSFLSNPVTWVVVTVVAVFGFNAIVKATPLKRVPVLNNKRNLMIIGIVGFLITSGIFGNIGLWETGSMGGGSWVVSDLQVTTSHGTDAGGTLSESSNYDDLLDVRFTDAQSNETSAILEINGTGEITVTRTGQLIADSCDVKCIVPAKFEDQSAPDGTKYSILEETALGESECYIRAAATSGSATTSSPKEKASLPFAEGIQTAYVSVVLEVEEGGHDALDQYNSKDVVIDICGKPFTYRIHRMDA